MALNVPTKISDYFWWGIWLRKLEETIIAPSPDWLEGQVWLQQMLWGWTAAITSIGQQNTKTMSAAAFVHSGDSKDHYEQMCQMWWWVCAWCRVYLITTQKQICKAVLLQQVCVYVRCVVTEEWLKVPRNLCRSQNYVSNKIFTLHFLNCLQYRGLNLLQK